MFTLLKSSVSLAALAIIFTAPAHSADVFGRSSTKDAPVASESRATSYTGLWIGALGGYQFSNAEVTEDFKQFHIDDDDVKTLKWQDRSAVDGLGSDGFVAELQAGYDQQIGSKYVVGVFGGLNLSDAEFSATASSGDPLETDTSLSIGYDWGGVLGLRAGFLKSADTLFYVGGGWAFAKLDDAVYFDGEDKTSFKLDNLNGWFGEIGMETRVSDNVFLTVAGRYTDYGSIDFTETYGPVNCPIEHTIEADINSLAVLVGLKAKLGGF